MSEISDSNTGVLSGGGVEYNIAEAAASIDELIETLQNMKENGLEYVVMSSGNYRGASWASIGTDWSWAEDDE
jgi:hypothetical protein